MFQIKSRLYFRQKQLFISDIFFHPMCQTLFLSYISDNFISFFVLYFRHIFLSYVSDNFLSEIQDYVKKIKSNISDNFYVKNIKSYVSDNILLLIFQTNYFEFILSYISDMFLHVFVLYFRYFLSEIQDHFQK